MCTFPFLFLAFLFAPLFFTRKEKAAKDTLFPLRRQLRAATVGGLDVGVVQLRPQALPKGGHVLLAQGIPLGKLRFGQWHAALILLRQLVEPEDAFIGHGSVAHGGLELFPGAVVELDGGAQIVIHAAAGSDQGFSPLIQL